LRLNEPVTMFAPRLVIGGVVSAFPSRVYTCYLTRPMLGRSKCAVVVAKYRPFWCLNCKCAVQNENFTIFYDIKEK
ncbi:hypothetical protein, partial [Paenibacillus apiarius]|uniref:hypothetical protein n=1 Tax=Paenibacillus apiarius TaxID=46240 RepID=UPI003B3B7748